MRITKIAIKPLVGRIRTAPIGKHHDDIGISGRHGFITDKGNFVGRIEGARIAKAAKQAPASVKQLHSHNLKK